MKIITINGFEEHLYDEGTGYAIEYLNKSVTLKRNKNAYSSKFTKRRNAYFLKLHYFRNSNDNLTILDQEHEDNFREDKSHKMLPFKEKKEAYVNVKSNTTNFVKLGYVDGNENFLSLDEKAYDDLTKINLKEFVMLDEDDIKNYIYPIKFNNSSFFRRGAKISLFDTINQVALSSFGVDKIKGFRGYSLNNSTDAEGRNVTVKRHFLKSDKENTQFEDGILEGHLYNQNLKKVVESINLLYNPVTKISQSSFTFSEKIKISNEPRYSKLYSQKIDPFKEYDKKSNNPYVKNNENFYYNKLSDENLNNILLDNSSIFNRLEESKLFKSAGRSIDYSISSGRESITFHESLD